MESQRSRITENLTAYDFYNITSELCAFPQCYHTFSVINEDLRKDNLFPFKTYYDGDKLWIVSDRTPFSEDSHSDRITISNGSEILSINSSGIPEIIQSMSNRIGADGGISTRIVRYIDRYFPQLYSLFSGYPDKYVIRYLETQTNEGLADRTSSKVEKKNVFSAIHRRNFNRKEPRKKTSSGHHALDLIIYEDSSLAKLRIRSFLGYSDENRELFDNFIKSSFDEIYSKRIKNLIIDIRGNGGGDPFSSTELLEYLIDKPYVYFDPSISYSHLKEKRNPKENRFEGKAYLWVDGLIGSTSGHFASLVKYHDLATFIGETTGSTYFCSGNAQIRELNNTKFRIFVGTGCFYTVVEGLEKGIGISVDCAVKKGIKDVLEDRDSYLEATLKLIDKNNANKAVILGELDKKKD